MVATELLLLKERVEMGDHTVRDLKETLIILRQNRKLVTKIN